MQVDVLRQLRRQARPRLAEVGGLEQVRPHVVQAVGVDDDVGRAGVEGRRLDAADRAPLRQALAWSPVTLVQVLPPSCETWTRPSSLPAQSSALLLRRLGDGEDGAVDLRRRCCRR